MARFYFSVQIPWLERSVCTLKGIGVARGWRKKYEPMLQSQESKRAIRKLSGWILEQIRFVRGSGEIWNRFDSSWRWQMPMGNGSWLWNNRNTDGEAMGEEPRNSREGLDLNLVANKLANTCNRRSSLRATTTISNSQHPPPGNDYGCEQRKARRSSITAVPSPFVCDSYRGFLLPDICAVEFEAYAFLESASGEGLELTEDRQ